MAAGQRWKRAPEGWLLPWMFEWQLRQARLNTRLLGASFAIYLAICAVAVRVFNREAPRIAEEL